MSTIIFDDELMEDAARMTRLYRKYCALSHYEQIRRIEMFNQDFGTFEDFMLWLQQELDRVNNSKPR